MIDTALGLSEYITQLLTVGFVVFLRIGAAIAVLPAFGERSIPQRLRLVSAIAFTFIVSSIVYSKIIISIEDQASNTLLIFSEVTTGLIIGISIRLFILALQICGTIIAQSTSLSQIFGSAALEPLPAIGHLLVISGLAVAVLAGLHIQIIDALVDTYRLFPVGNLVDPSSLARWGTERIAQAFSLAFTLAAPFVVASVIYNLTLGIINKAMPQLMVAFVGAPAITLGGLVLLLLTVPALLYVWNAELQSFILNPFAAHL